MFGLFKKKQEMVELDSKLEKAFSTVDNDIRKIQEWVSHLYQKHGQLESGHREIRLKHQDIDNLNRWVGYLHKHSTDLHSKVQVMEQQMIQLATGLDTLRQEVESLKASSASSVRTRSEPGSEPNLNRTSAFEERFISRHLRPNKKNYVLAEIVKQIKAEELTTKRLEELIVKEKELCGRTTFYAYLKELKDKGLLNNAELGSKTILIAK